MIAIGRFNRLKIIKAVPFGVYLDGGELGEILLPLKYVPDTGKPGDDLDIFLYLDSEERLIATTLKPVAQVGEFAFMTVVSNSKFGSFLKWNIEKDLFVAFKEQKNPLIIGKSYLFYVYFDDESGRIAASQKFYKFLSQDTSELSEGEEVKILVYELTPMGWKAIINHKYFGMLYRNEVFNTEVKVGFESTAYIKKIREDGKLDLSLNKAGYGNIRDFTEILMEMLVENDGFLSFNDNSSPELIYANFGVSKKVFKKAVGSLYKNRKIRLINGGIEWIK
jgi:predicted RNA-binding protein (virulence factor B family)